MVSDFRDTVRGSACGEKGLGWLIDRYMKSELHSVRPNENNMPSFMEFCAAMNRHPFQKSPLLFISGCDYSHNSLVG